MTGYLKIEAVNFDGKRGVCGETHLENVGIEDKAALLDAFMTALRLSEEDLLNLLVFKTLFMECGKEACVVDSGAIEKIRDAMEEGKN